MTDRGVEIATIWERTSVKGTRYFSGFLGNARVLLFRDDEAELRDGVAGVWKLIVQAKDQPIAAKTITSAPRRRTDAFVVSHETQRPRSKEASTAELDDDISFIGDRNR